MLRRLSPKERIALFVETWEPTIRAAFMSAINSIRSSVTLRLVVEAMERGDIGRALDALHIEREAFGGLETAIADAWNAGGVNAAEDMAIRDPEGHRVVFRFGVRDPASEALIRSHAAGLVTRVTGEQIENARVVLSEGLARGDNPTRTALNLVGRVSRVTGERTGGLIGLSAPNATTVENARHALTAGDVEGMRAYLQLKRRDKRFDAAVRKAIETGKPIPAQDAARITGRLSDGYLKLRGDTIARTETMTALNGSRNEAMRQAIASGRVSADLVTKTWRATHDGRTRFTHAVLHGQAVRFDEQFVSPSGARLLYPGDPSAPASEHVGCRCNMEVKIDYTGQLLRRRAN